MLTRVEIDRWTQMAGDDVRLRMALETARQLYQERDVARAELERLDEGFIQAAYYYRDRDTGESKPFKPEYTERPSRPEWWSDTPARRIARLLRGLHP